MRAIIEEDSYTTHDIIEAVTTINHFTINESIHNSLKKIKLSRWIPQELTDQNRKDRVEACKKNLALFRNGLWRLRDIITEDESWFYLRQVGHKSGNASWVGKGESPRTVVRRDSFEPKRKFYIFFKATGVVHLDYVEKGDTVTGQYYGRNCLKPIISEINKQRHVTGTQNLKFLHDNARPHFTQNVTGCLNRLIEYETSKIVNFKFQNFKLVTKKWVNKSKKLNLKFSLKN